MMRTGDADIDVRKYDVESVMKSGISHGRSAERTLQKVTLKFGLYQSYRSEFVDVLVVHFMHPTNLYFVVGMQKG